VADVVVIHGLRTERCDPILPRPGAAKAALLAA
jgi:hypothetical protein